MTHCPIWKIEVKKTPLKGNVKGVKTKPFTMTREHVFKQTICCFNFSLFEKHHNRKIKARHKLTRNHRMSRKLKIKFEIFVLFSVRMFHKAHGFLIPQVQAWQCRKQNFLKNNLGTMSNGFKSKILIMCILKKNSKFSNFCHQVTF